MSNTRLSSGVLSVIQKQKIKRKVNDKLVCPLYDKAYHAYSKYIYHITCYRLSFINIFFKQSN